MDRQATASGSTAGLSASLVSSLATLQLSDPRGGVTGSGAAGRPHCGSGSTGAKRTPSTCLAMNRSTTHLARDKRSCAAGPAAADRRTRRHDATGHTTERRAGGTPYPCTRPDRACDFVCTPRSFPASVALLRGLPQLSWRPSDTWCTSPHGSPLPAPSFRVRAMIYGQFWLRAGAQLGVLARGPRPPLCPRFPEAAMAPALPHMGSAPFLELHMTRRARCAAPSPGADLSQQHGGRLQATQRPRNPAIVQRRPDASHQWRRTRGGPAVVGRAAARQPGREPAVRRRRRGTHLQQPGAAPAAAPRRANALFIHLHAAPVPLRQRQARPPHTVPVRPAAAEAAHFKRSRAGTALSAQMLQHPPPPAPPPARARAPGPC